MLPVLVIAHGDSLRVSLEAVKALQVTKFGLVEDFAGDSHI